MDRFERLVKNASENFFTRAVDKLAPSKQAIIKASQWLFTNIPLSFCMYYGLHKHVQGALNIVVFWTWASFFLTTIVFITMALSKGKYSSYPKRKVPIFISTIVELSFVACFAYYGKFLYASLIFIGYILGEAIYSEGETKAKTNESSKA